MPALPKLKYWRELAALSQKELADKSGVAKTTVGRLERAEALARPSTIRRLAQALGTSPRDLINGDFLASK